MIRGKHVLYCLCPFLSAMFLTLNLLLQRSCPYCPLFLSREVRLGSRPKLVLVLTYLRSGSTLTGDVLQQSPNSLYMYEPLRSHNSHVFLDGQICHTFTMNCSKYDTEKIKALFDDLFTCRLQKHKMSVLVPRRHSLAIMSVIPSCKSRPGFDTCMTKIQRLCHQSHSVILKTIRFSMELLPDLMENFPDLRVIHLLRDPRGIMDSRRRGGFLRHFGMEQSVTSLCDLMRKNIEFSKILQGWFPGRITTVLYENIAERPLELSHQLYRRLKLEYSNDFEEWVFNHTSAGTPNNSYYGTIRSNSSQTSQSWRKRLKFEDVRLIENKCADVIEKLGFRNVIDEKDQKNTARTLRVRTTQSYNNIKKDKNHR